MLKTHQQWRITKWNVVEVLTTLIWYDRWEIWLVRRQFITPLLSWHVVDKETLTHTIMQINMCYTCSNEHMLMHTCMDQGYSFMHSFILPFSASITQGFLHNTWKTKQKLVNSSIIKITLPTTYPLVKLKVN